MRKNKNRGYQKLRVWNDLAHLVNQFRALCLLEIETDSRRGISMAHFASKSVGAGEKTRIGHKRAGGEGK